MNLSFVAVFIGAGFGALLRHGFNLLGKGMTAGMAAGFSEFIPWGTLISNCLGGYLVGLAVAFFTANPNLSPEWRLLIITGFLGGLTTFSSFSVEVVDLLQRNQFLWAAGLAFSHLAGSLILTMIGFWTYQIIK
jgi:CrcB protein